MSAVNQLDLLEFALDEALRRRQEGMNRVMEGADTEYRDRLLGAVEILAMKGWTFCSDDARDIAGDPPRHVHVNIAGAVFNAAAKAGLIRCVGYGISRRPQGNGNLIRLWRGAA